MKEGTSSSSNLITASSQKKVRFTRARVIAFLVSRSLAHLRTSTSTFSNSRPSTFLLNDSELINWVRSYSALLSYLSLRVECFFKGSNTRSSQIVSISLSKNWCLLSLTAFFFNWLLIASLFLSCSYSLLAETVSMTFCGDLGYSVTNMKIIITTAYRVHMPLGIKNNSKIIQDRIIGRGGYNSWPGIRLSTEWIQHSVLPNRSAIFRPDNRYIHLSFMCAGHL